ncbi:hypothetical protein JCM8547_004511 [Rhodosporidiobolus lusitaniae]
MDDFSQLAPHPSYALEDSDGESDWDENELPVHMRQSVLAGKKELVPDAVVELRGAVDGLSKGAEVVWLTGEAGERIAQGLKLDGLGEEVQVLVDGEQVGSIYPSQTGATLVFLSIAVPLASLHPLASTLLSTLSPSTSTIIASYHLPSYIPPNDNEDSTPTSPAPLLFLSSSSKPSAVSSLASSRIISPFTPPNLLHGLPSQLLILSALLTPSSPTTLLLLPTTTPPSPLNGPFPLLSPITSSSGSGTSIYDAGGPTGLSDPGALFRELAGPTGPLGKVKESLGWSWWDAQGRGGKAFDWLEKQRRDRRREEVGSMYM